MPLARRTFLVMSVVALVTIATSCREIPPGALGESRSDTAGERPDLKVALLGAVSGSSAGPAVRALEGARFALDEVNAEGDLPVDLVTVLIDTEEDPVATTTAIAEEIVADPEVIAVIGWPSEAEAEGVTRALDEAGIAFLDVSPAASGLADLESSAWIRTVATDARQAESLAGVIGVDPQGVCLSGDGSARSTAMRRLVSRDLREQGVTVMPLPSVPSDQAAYPGLVQSVLESGCGTLFWGADAADAAVVRLELTAEGGSRVRVAGTDAMKNQAYLAETGREGDGTLASCSCVELSGGEGSASRGFIQEFQARYGGTPGPYAVEGYDAGRFLVSAVTGGHADRRSLADLVAERSAFEGLAGRYAFDANGERSGGAKLVAVYEARAGRWESLSDGHTLGG